MKAECEVCYRLKDFIRNVSTRKTASTWREIRIQHMKAHHPKEVKK